MAEKIEKMIILEVKEYAEVENAALVTALTDHGILTLIASGIFKPTSKNRPNLLPGSISEIEYFPTRLKNKVARLKKANIIVEPDYENAFFGKIFIDKAIKFLKHFPNPYPPIYNAYVECLKHQKEGKSVYLLTYLVANGLGYFGIQPNIETCVECGSPGNLCDFELYYGGYLCGNHIKNNKRRWTKELKCYYYIFKNLNTYLNICIPEVNEKIYRELISYYIDNGIYVDWENLKKH